MNRCHSQKESSSPCISKKKSNQNQANQRNSITVIDWTSQIPLKVAFASGNNQDVINLQLFIKY